MWFFPTKKEVKKEFEKIKGSFKKRDSKIDDLKKEIVSKKEIELMIKEAVLDLKASQLNKLREVNPRTPRTKRRTKVNKLLDRAEIMSEMLNLSKKGYSTGEIYNIIVEEKQLIKKTCFFKYMKLIRENSARTPRTT